MGRKLKMRPNKVRNYPSDILAKRKAKTEKRRSQKKFHKC